MQRVDIGADITHNNRRMQVCEILSQGDANTKSEITACKYRGVTPLTRSPEFIGRDWDLRRREDE